MKTVEILIKGFYFVIAPIMIFALMFHGTRFLHLTILGEIPRTCTELPEGYFLVELPDNRGWTVCSPDGKRFLKYYLGIKKTNFFPWKHIDLYDVKLDSCQAKEALQMYLAEQNKNRIREEFMQKRLK